MMRAGYRLTTAYGNFAARDLLVADVDRDGHPDVLVLMSNRLTVRRGGTQSVTIASRRPPTPCLRRHGLRRPGGHPGRAEEDRRQRPHAAAQQWQRPQLSRVPFPHPDSGSGDTATYVANWNGAGQPAMLISHGLFTSGPTSFVAASCSK